jgi:hypothetical protein
MASEGCGLIEQVYADATLVFPLVVAATFGKAHWEEQARKEPVAVQ